MDAELPWLWRWLTRPHFRHVCMMRYDLDFDVWLFVEWSSRRLYVELYRGEDVDGILHKFREEGVLLAIDTQALEKNSRPRMPLYCVTWAKQLLGIDAPFVLTPHQLACELLKRGADVIFDKYLDGDDHGNLRPAGSTEAPASRS